MPLRDHFRPPLDDLTSWEGFHGQCHSPWSSSHEARFVNGGRKWSRSGIVHPLFSVTEYIHRSTAPPIKILPIAGAAYY